MLTHEFDMKTFKIEFSLQKIFIDFYKDGKYSVNETLNLSLLDGLADKVYPDDTWRKLVKSIFRKCNDEILTGSIKSCDSTDPCKTKTFLFDDCFIEHVVIVSAYLFNFNILHYIIIIFTAMHRLQGFQ